jgi:hypothetical protein
MKPILQALVIAERIYQDISGKKIIAGTFHHVRLKKRMVRMVQSDEGAWTKSVRTGSELGSPAAYISLTEVFDRTTVTAQFVNVGKNEVLFQKKIRLASRDRLATIEIILPLPPLVRFVKTAGTYSLDLMWNGELLGSQRIIARKDEPG